MLELESQYLQNYNEVLDIFIPILQFPKSIFFDSAIFIEKTGGESTVAKM
jgi:hypothetical protein